MSWWQTQPNRLLTEQKIISQKFPQFKLGQAAEDKKINGMSVVKEGQKYWIGDLKTISGNPYTVLIVYPDHYPGREIRSYVIKPTLPVSNHMYGDGHLCLYSNDHGGRGQGHGKGMTAASYIAWTAAWLHAYEISTKNGQWPDNNFFDR